MAWGLSILHAAQALPVRRRFFGLSGVMPSVFSGVSSMIIQAPTQLQVSEWLSGRAAKSRNGRINSLILGWSRVRGIGSETAVKRCLAEVTALKSMLHAIFGGR